MGLFKQGITGFEIDIAKKKEEVKEEVMELIKEMEKEIEAGNVVKDLSKEELESYALLATKIYFDNVRRAHNEYVSECEKVLDLREFENTLDSNVNSTEEE